MFLFNFENSFHSGDNQILTFEVFKCHDVSSEHILLNNLGIKHSLVMKSGQFR